MKNIYILFVIFPFLLMAQSQDQNYVKTKNYKAETLNAIPFPAADQAKVDLVYFDGLGRPIQKVEHLQSAFGTDILTHIGYDQLGRQDKEYLPYVKNQQNMFYDPNAESNTLGYQAYAGHPNPYSRKFFEKTPLSRPVKQAAPGTSWIGNENNDSDRTVKFIYDINSTTDKVQYFYVSSGLLASNGYYQAGSLYKTITKDENWTAGKVNTAEEFKDSQGMVVLKRVHESEISALDTYYVYDPNGNLTFVIPPLASDSIATTTSSQVPYSYYQSINLSDIMINYTNGGGGGGITIENNTIKLSFNSGFTATQIDVTKSITINASQPVPNMTIGTLNAGFPRYTVYVENNQLKFIDNYPNSGNYTTLNHTVTAPLDTSVFGTQTVYSTVINQDVIPNLCYQYKYDVKYRLMEKKLPGKQWEYIVYDKLDRIVATGPALSPFTDLTSIGWLVTKYDAFNRPVITGWMPAASGIDSATRQNLQTQMNSVTTNFNESKSASDNTINGVAVRYTNVAFPTSGYHVMSINYYDDYGYANAPAIFDPVEGQEVYFNATRKPKGLSTGSWVRILGTSTAYAGELSYNLYDYKERPIRAKTLNYLGGHTTVDSKLDFSGKTLYSIMRHSRAGGTDLYIKDSYTYTNQDRLVTHMHQIGENGIPQLLAKNEYDELGQLITKRIGGTDATGNLPLQKLDYTYTIRGWLKGINETDNLSQIGDPTDLFAFRINYDTVENNVLEQVKPLYNGNISEVFWRTDSDNVKRSYGYTYDSMSRLNKAIYQKSNTATSAYNEEMGYDKNGNIQFLKRNGAMDSQNLPQEIDDLIYTYDANKKNQLMNVYDDSISPEGFIDDGDNATNNPVPDYGYDDNGNMNKDDNKGITAIVYNHLNLPTKIVFGSEARKIEYIYNAGGVKVQKAVTANGETTFTSYLGGFQYKGKSLLFFPTAEGYVNYIPAVYGGTLGNEVLITPESYNYVFNYTDHLGNIRLSYGVDPSTQMIKIIEENHYYPFGLKHTKYNTDWNLFERVDGSVKLRPGRPAAPLEFKYKYNGKEHQDELGLNMYDYGARNYDAAIGRWMNMDKQSEKWNTYSPYIYVLNNPLTYLDPDGNDVIVAFTGGPTGGGKTIDANSKDASTAGRLVQEAQKFAEENNIEFSGRVITPGVTSGSSIKNAMGFIKENYSKGEKVVIYGYSYGGDFAVELAEALKEEGISVDLLITVDAADGTGPNYTVDSEISENVKNAVNFFQDTPSGLPLGAQHGTNSSKRAGKKSKEDSGNSNGSPASHGGKKRAANSKKTDVRNYRVQDKNVNHGNIDEKTESLINKLIQSIMNN